MASRTLPTLLAFLAFVSLGLPDALLGVAWPSISGDFAQPLDALGLLFAVTTAGYLTSSFISGAVLRRMQVGTVLALSTLAAAMALLGYAIAPSWPFVVAFGFVAGLGGGAVDAGINAFAAKHFTARVLNWLHAFFGLGTTIGPLIVTAVLSAGLGWRWSYAIVGVAQLTLAAAFFLSRRIWAATPAAAGAEGAATPAAPSMSTLRRPSVWLGMGVFFLYTGVEVGTAQWAYSLLTLGRGFTETAAGLSVSLYWGSLMAGRIAFGIVANRVALAPALRVSMIGAALGALLLSFHGAAPLSVTGLMLMGLSLAPVFASLISLTPKRVGAEHANNAIGFQIAAAGLGGASLTALLGVLARAFGLEAIGVAIFAAALTLALLYELLSRSAGTRIGTPAAGSRS